MIGVVRGRLGLQVLARRAMIVLLLVTALVAMHALADPMASPAPMTGARSAAIVDHAAPVAAPEAAHARSGQPPAPADGMRECSAVLLSVPLLAAVRGCGPLVPPAAVPVLSAVSSSPPGAGALRIATVLRI